MPKTVLHIVKALGLGGTEKVMQLMVANLDRKLFEPVVCSLIDGERAAVLRQLGITTYVEGDLFTNIMKINPDLIHVHRAGWAEPDYMRPITSARRLLQNKTGKIIPLVETNVFGHHDPSPAGREVDCTLFVSHFCARRFSKLNEIKIQAPRYDVLYNPIDFETIKNLNPLTQKRDYSRPVIGRVSRPDPGKWSDLALTWLPEACAARPDLSYLIIGGIERAHEYVQTHQLEKQVQFLPLFLDDHDLAKFLSGISIFAHANDRGESFGLVIAEAMAAGLPVITHPCEGLRDNAQLELVEHERTGLVVHNSKQYAEAVLWLLNNPLECRRLGEAGQAKAAALFSAKVVAFELGLIYQKLLSPNAFLRH